MPSITAPKPTSPIANFNLLEAVLSSSSADKASNIVPCVFSGNTSETTLKRFSSGSVKACSTATPATVPFTMSLPINLPKEDDAKREPPIIEPALDKAL